MPRRCVLVMTPNCGAVYVAAIADTVALECFWREELNTQQRMAAGNWLSSEGWFHYANGVIDLDQGLFDRIQEETVI